MTTKLFAHCSVPPAPEPPGSARQQPMGSGRLGSMGILVILLVLGLAAFFSRVSQAQVKGVQIHGHYRLGRPLHPAQFTPGQI